MLAIRRAVEPDTHRDAGMPATTTTAKLEGVVLAASTRCLPAMAFGAQSKQEPLQFALLHPDGLADSDHVKMALGDLSFDAAACTSQLSCDLRQGEQHAGLSLGGLRLPA